MNSLLMLRFCDLLREALAEGQPFALGIISRSKGSSPQKQGAKALFFSDGRIKGTLGGGCLEAEIQDRARRALRTGEPATFELVLDHDFGWDDGLICGGKVCGLILPRAAEADDVWQSVLHGEAEVPWGVRDDFTIAHTNDDEEGSWLYRETATPPCVLWIAGSGHVAQAVAPVAAQLGFEVTVFDDRPALANTQHFPSTTRFRVDAWDKLLRDPLPARATFGLIVTRGHQHDALVLKAWIQRPFAFLGMIGSNRKRRIIFDQFVQEHIATEEQLSRVECPVGIDIDAVSVPEIAISIAAQLVQKRAEHLQRVESSLLKLPPAAPVPA
ncbi:MAG TPA: XdhC family protein [Methylomirabilota bacterium]|nr:XdhC family protein [Methylomirabilota bacterium]